MATKVEDAGKLLAYRTYTHTPSGENRLTREATTNQEWVFQVAGGKKFTIKFDKNFVKKHLFTYSKKTAKVQELSYYIWEASGKSEGKELENWLKAEQVALNQKMEKTVVHRAEKMLCTCGHLMVLHTCTSCTHPRVKHFTGGGASTPCKGGGTAAPCGCSLVEKCAGSGGKACACAGFSDTEGTYAGQRTASGKGDNPLAGAPTAANTSLVLSLIPKADFEKVVVDSIKAIETDAFTWATNAQHHLKWDFGPSRKGCVVQVDLAQSSDQWGKLQGVYVTAKKLTATSPTDLVYQVFHLESKAPHAPF
jgi:hypothetical protein